VTLTTGAAGSSSIDSAVGDYNDLSSGVCIQECRVLARYQKNAFTRSVTSFQRWTREAVQEVCPLHGRQLAMPRSFSPQVANSADGQTQPTREQTVNRREPKPEVPNYGNSGTRNDIKRDAADALLGFDGVSDSQADVERAAVERALNPLRHITHHAFACRDAESTRNFYEDVLGMPLVAALVLEDPFLAVSTKYCHFFFEMADGSCLAFFDHPEQFTAGDFLAQIRLSPSRGDGGRIR
jgi:hypothetical protein